MPQIVGATTAGGWQGQTTLTVPDGARAGDLLLAWLSANDAAGRTPPAGWSLVAEVVDAPIGNLTGVALYSRRATDDEPDQHTWTWTGAHWHHGICVAVRGVESIRAHQVDAGEDVSALTLPELEAQAGDVLLAFGYHWGTDAGTQPVIEGMETIASQDSVLVAAREAVPSSGATPTHEVSSSTVGRMAAAAVLLAPVPSAPAPAWEEAPAQQPLPPRAVWRYYAFRALSREWVHRELPLRDVSIEHTLSGPGGLTASIEPTYADLVAPDGQLVLREWDTVIVAEAAGQIRGGGILTDMEITGDELSLDCIGFAGYTDMPLTVSQRWGGATVGLTGQGVDAAAVVRALWDHLQERPDGNLGVQVDNISTPYRVGEWHNARRLPTDDEPNPDPAEVEEPPIPIDRVWTNQDSRPAAATGKSVYWQYRLDWWEDIEVGAKIDELCQQAAIDYREVWNWADSDRESVTLRLELGHPRLGRRASNLRFVEAENISEVVTLQRGGDEYANIVAAYGSGEGSKQLRQTATQPSDGRLRRVAIVDAEDVGSEAALLEIARDYLDRASKLTDITGFVVRDHPNAPLGSFAAGDDVLVETVLGWQPTRMWVRILSYSYSPDGDTVDVTCARSDSFDYTRR